MNFGWSWGPESMTAVQARYGHEIWQDGLLPCNPWALIDGKVVLMCIVDPEFFMVLSPKAFDLKNQLTGFIVNYLSRQLQPYVCVRNGSAKSWRLVLPFPSENWMRLRKLSPSPGRMVQWIAHSVCCTKRTSNVWIIRQLVSQVTCGCENRKRPEISPSSS